MKYKIRYLLNKFYHLIKFIIPAFFIGIFTVNANVVPYECLQYDNYFNIASIYRPSSSSYNVNRDSNFYNLEFRNNQSYLMSSSNMILATINPSYINTCTSQVTDETTGVVNIQNNYSLYEFTTTTTNFTGDLISLFNQNSASNPSFFRMMLSNTLYANSNVGQFFIDKTTDKIIYPMYFRSNKNNLTIENVISKIVVYFELANNKQFRYDTSQHQNDYSFQNLNMYFEQDNYFYYTFDLVMDLTSMPVDYYQMPVYNNSNTTSQYMYLDIYPNTTYLLDSANSPMGIFFGMSTAFFINDEVLTQPNWIETGINDWIITNNPNETLGPLEEFFNNFNLQDNRGISQIITIPIRIVQSFLSSSCDSITLDIFTSRNDDNLTIQSGCSFWNTMSPIKNLLNIFVDGFICFEILKAIYLEIDKLKDPSDKSKIERSDL